MKITKINFLTRMRLWQKFALLGALALVALAAPYVQVVRTTQEGINFAAAEVSGLEPTQAALRMVQLTQQHRALSGLVLGGIDAQSQPRAAKQAEVEQALAAIDRQVAPVDSKAVKDGWNAIKARWKGTVAEVSGRTVDARKSFDSHTVLINDMLVFVDTLGDYYKMLLDSTAHTYYLIQASLLQLPALTEQLGQLRAVGTARLAEAARLRAANADVGTAVTGADRARVTSLIDTAKLSEESAYRSLAKALEAEPRMRALLEADMSVPQEAARQLRQLARKEIVDAATPAFDSVAYERTFTEGIDAQFKFLSRVSEVLSSELTGQAAALRRNQLVISAGILALTLVAAAIAFLTVRNITGTVAGLQGSVEKVRLGDFTALQAIDSQDEVGDLGRTVNDLLQERIAAQQKAEAENERLNNSVISILQAVNQLSQRDLTAKAPVTQDIIGTVSDSINLLTDETSKVLHDVTRIARQLEEASGKVKSQAELVSKTAEDERKSVTEMVDSLADATQQMNQVAALAEQSGLSAERATAATDTALETVNNTVKGMESIRETIAETEKRIKRLGERSQEITGIVNLINTISERTHVLALNASMQAAVAGEAGRGFAVVAEEVQRLAESSRNATQQIGTLVSNIQLETNETISTVNRTIGQVVHGSEQAQKAGEQMRLTQEITGQLVAQVRRIAASSEQQKDMSVQLLQSVQRIGQSTERTGQQIDAQNHETNTLQESARRLVESVNVFKLPALV
ncbi:MAG TPA: HAMP domain-containing methyl-accepting chemotaxis protein [Burkholderiaceae bacterium]|nr:HAMP domain-containing methyl-accepting chemotaxis protein [Burkholderiaceae bacterium]